MKTYKDVDSYIADAPVGIREKPTKLRRAIQKAAPRVIERISYGMPFYQYGGSGYSGRLVYFAGFKKHIGKVVKELVKGRDMLNQADAK